MRPAPKFTCSKCGSEQTCSQYGCSHRWKFPSTMYSCTVCLACAPQPKFEWIREPAPKNAGPDVIDPKSCWCKMIEVDEDYTREDVGPMDPMDALACANDWNDWERQLGAWRRTFSYRWVDGHIVYPLPLEETRRRAAILAFSLRFMSAFYHWKKRVLITHVAIRCNGKVYSLPAPNRHHHVIWMIAKETNNRVDASGDDQGFLDENGLYYSRRPALIHALRNNQVKDMKDIRAGRLFSENLW